MNLCVYKAQFLPKLSLQITAFCHEKRAMSRSSPWFAQSTHAWDHDPPFWRPWTACILWLGLSYRSLSKIEKIKTELSGPFLQWKTVVKEQGPSQDFSKGGHTVSKWGYSPDCQVFLPPVVGCLLKKWLQNGGSQAQQDPPGFATEEFGLPDG